MRIGANIFSLIVLALLIQGHSAWLNQMGVHGFAFASEQFSQGPAGLQLLVMASFRIAFFVAFVVTTIETFMMVVQLIRAGRNDSLLRITTLGVMSK